MSGNECADSAANSPLVACEKTEVGHIIELGLGRGIDATSLRPWRCKTSFQVRPVVYEELIGTEEAGAVNEFTSQIKSANSLQKMMLSAITQSKTPVVLEVFGEKQRASNGAGLKSTGRKVSTRGISYREDCALRASTATSDCFEERLWKWICEKQKFQVSGPDINVLESFDQVVDKASKPVEQREKVIKACRKFVNVYRVTHYATRIDLGAIEYTVEQSGSDANEADEELRKKLKKKPNTAETVDRRDGMKIDKKKMGIINDDGTVTRRSHGEVVLAVHIQPISHLIEQPFLRLALQLALVQFIEDSIDKEGGPYFIGLNDGNIFLSVNDSDSTVGATTDVDNAAPFYISQPENAGEPVLISYYKKTVTGEHTAKLKVHKIARYLQVSSNKRVPNSDFLEVQYHIRQKSFSRFMFYDRFDKKPVNDEIGDILSSNSEGYYIKCSGKTETDGFLAVRKNEEGEYKVTCCGHKDSHDDDSMFMLFQIISPSITRFTETSSDQVKDIKVTLEKKYKLKL